MSDFAIGARLISGEEFWSDQSVPAAVAPSLRLVMESAPLAFAVALTNQSGEAIRLDKIMLVGRGRAGTAALNLGGSWPGWCFYCHGWQAWSPSWCAALEDGRQPRMSPAYTRGNASPEICRLSYERLHRPIPVGPGELGSHFFGAIHAPNHGTLVLGFLRQDRQFGQVILGRPERREELPVLTAHVDLEGLVLPDGAELASEPLGFWFGPDLEPLHEFAAAVAPEGGNCQGKSPLGWCSWYYYFTRVGEEAVLANLETLAGSRDFELLRLVQIDDGYQREIGDWLEPSERFPHGLAWLARRIRERGFRPGLWLAPFLVGARSRLYRDHPDWLVREPDGAPALALYNWEQECYALDTTNPAALAHLRGVIRAVRREWGIDYLKADFVYAAAIPGRRADPGATGAQAYRLGMEAVREEMNPGYLLGCGAPLGPTVGLVDANRIGPDVGPSWRHQSLDPTRPGAEHALRPVLTRSFAQRRWWLNDPDCALLRADETDLNGEEVRTLATVIALSGGPVLDSDRLDLLPPERRSILRAMIPAGPEGAEALDLLTHDFPGLFALRVERPWADWRTAAVLNWRDEPAAGELDLDRLLGPGREAEVFSFWEGRYLGRKRGMVRLGPLPAHGVGLLRVQEPVARPHLVGSDFHLTMGAAEIENEEYDPGNGLYRLRIRRPFPQEGRIWLVFPDGTAPRPFTGGGILAWSREEHHVWRVTLAVDGALELEVGVEKGASAGR